MHKPRCLLIDDSEEIHQIVHKTLNEICVVVSAYTGSEARKQIESKPFDLVIIDLNLVNENGMDLLKEFKEGPATNQNTRYFIMTANTSPLDEAQGHNHGVDEYLKKPVEREVLKAIVRKNLKALKDQAPAVIDEPHLYILPDNHQAFLITASGREEIVLTVKEFKLLVKLVSHPEKTFSREDLFAQVWDNDSNSTFRTIDMHISSLRKKLKDQGHLIKTIHQVGYKYSKS